MILLQVSCWTGKFLRQAQRGTPSTINLDTMEHSALRTWSDMLLCFLPYVQLYFGNWSPSVLMIEGICIYSPYYHRNRIWGIDSEQSFTSQFMNKTMQKVPGYRGSNNSFLHEYPFRGRQGNIYVEYSEHSIFPNMASSRHVEIEYMYHDQSRKISWQRIWRVQWWWIKYWLA